MAEGEERSVFRARGLSMRVQPRRSARRSTLLVATLFAVRSELRKERKLYSRPRSRRVAVPIDADNKWMTPR